MIVELRKLGVGMEKIKEIKDFFFAPDFIDSFFSSPITDKEFLSKEIEEIAEKKGLLKNNRVQIIEEVRKIFEELQFTRFFYMLFSTIITRNHYIFYMDSK